MSRERFPLVLHALLLSLAMAPVGCGDSGGEERSPATTAGGDSAGTGAGTDGSAGESGEGAEGGSTSAGETDDETGGESAGETDGPDDGAFPDPDTSRLWIHEGPTSAAVYFRAGDIETEARSYVEYGPTSDYGMTTPTTDEARLAQFHRLNDLEPDTTYHVRLVLVTEDGEIASPDETFTTASPPGAIRIPADVAGPPYVLDQSGATYVLTEDISAPETAIEVTGDDVTLELDGHTVTFGTDSPTQCRGVFVDGGGTAVVRNGHFLQGDGAGDYSAAVESRYRPLPIEVYAISTDVHRPNGYPLRLFGSAANASIHHNVLYSTVTVLESRHYPGNDLLRIEAEGPGIRITDNILTEGAHRGITMGGEAPGGVIAYNDIRHHMRYTNGYALNLSASGLDVHDNRVTSMGRGVHLTGPDVQIHDNYFDLRGHMTLDDLPAGAEFLEARVEVHGIKFEGGNVVGARIFDNYVRVTQPQPDGMWDFTPATPLNLGGNNPNANNEVYGNTFVALTSYPTTQHGDYFNSGQWAASIYMIGMDGGTSSADNYAVYVHDNEFISNDVFVGAGGTMNMTARIEDNDFVLADDPPPTAEHARYYNLDAALEMAIDNGGNTFTE